MRAYRINITEVPYQVRFLLKFRFTCKSELHSRQNAVIFTLNRERFFTLTRETEYFTVKGVAENALLRD